MATMLLRFSLMMAIYACTTASQPVSAAEIPPVPAQDGVGFFIHDYAELLDDETTERIAINQETAFTQYDTPVIVITIKNMAAYHHSGTIEELATVWFNEWQIGTLDLDEGQNRGVLVLVSVGDRKARIELGADWGHDWNDYCSQVIQNDMIPHFRDEDYASGIAAGVTSLTRMAAKGVEGKPPRRRFAETAKNAANRGQRGTGGCFSCLLFPLLFLFSIVSRFFGFGGSGGGGSFGGSGFSGGGFSGGFSGGGGASGSW